MGRNPQPAFDRSAQAEGDSTPAPRPHQDGYGSRVLEAVVTLETALFRCAYVNEEETDMVRSVAMLLSDRTRRWFDSFTQVGYIYGSFITIASCFYRCSFRHYGSGASAFGKNRDRGSLWANGG
ncbi:MAG: hypothetical protein RBJ76_28290 [Stenomitos frigidus ULC029]